MNDLDRAAMSYLAIAIDKGTDWNSLLCTWHPNREVIGHTFQRHDFAFKWAYAEMAPTITGLGYDWVITQTAKSLKELIELVSPQANQPERGQRTLYAKHHSPSLPPPLTITCASADRLDHVEDASVDAVVMDPPYYDNVMYAELADFFYVWLKRTAGLLFPEPFSAYLTDKDREAVANPARFKDFGRVKGAGGARRRAAQDYQERMQGIFAECRRVLRPDGIMVLMFTHKATGAWDALAQGLVEAGFTVTASWPVHTEAEGSLHIRDKNAARSTIFLACRPRSAPEEGKATFWEDVEPEVVRVVREKVEDFQKAGIAGVDLYLASFGPALKVFSEHWPLQRGRPAQKPPATRGVRVEPGEAEDWDPYAVRPEDALMAARAAVKEWRLSKLSTVGRRESLDPFTEFFVLAWDAFRSPQFPADEGLKLARVVGPDLAALKGKILEVKGGDVLLWDSVTRAQKGQIGSPESKVLLDLLHLAARAGREQNTGAARDLLERAGVLEDKAFHAALEAVLNVLPAPREVAGTKVGLLAGAAADAGALEKLRRLALRQEVPPPPKQRELYE